MWPVISCWASSIRWAASASGRASCAASSTGASSSGRCAGSGATIASGPKPWTKAERSPGRTEAIETANGSWGSAVRTSAIALRAGTGAAPSPA